ncbi:MAG: hypothetical protein KGL35_16300 [Bradyrhizobium sp.]|nr:hypothetical protein [Bradyrhizobium sp.]
MTPRPWDRKLWGVTLMPTQPESGERPLLLGSLWDDGVEERGAYPGEPTRAFLFQTRNECRAWIKARRGDFFGKHYRCVRVRERVEVL